MSLVEGPMFTNPFEIEEQRKVDVVKWRRIMKRLIRLALLSTTLSLVPGLAKGDGVLLSWSPGDVPGVTEASFNAAKSIAAEEIPKKNLTVTSWPETFLLMVGANQHKTNQALLKALALQLTNNTKVDLKATNRLIIWERITSGEIQFEGKGYQVTDDLFTVSGRANWILRNLAKKNFGYVRPTTSAEDLSKLQQSWQRFLNGESVENVAEQYVTQQKGLEEIRSREALEALITSLKPTAEKEKVTVDCLKRVYKLDKLPDDPNSPATMCSPDKYTHSYLSTISEVKDRHDYAWWNGWWTKNSASLKWNAGKGTFEVNPNP